MYENDCLKNPLGFPNNFDRSYSVDYSVSDASAGSIVNVEMKFWDCPLI